MSDPSYLTIPEVGRAYATRQLSPIEMTEYSLARIERLDPHLHSYVTVLADAARRDARASDRRFANGESLGPLDGVPVGAKDLFDTAGIRTTAHSRLFADRVPTADATAIRRLRQAGAVLLGKHSMYELALGRPAGPSDGISPPARNPWDLRRVPGGSSSGSAAAVAADLCTVALGSDSGGSIRVPASSCGVVGLKPTYGVVSRTGVIPLSWTLDHVGPIARTVQDAAFLLDAIAGHDPTDPSSARGSLPEFAAAIHRSVVGLRIGAPRSLLASAGDLDSGVLAAYDSALKTFERLGVEILEIDIAEALEHAPTICATVMLTEALSFHERDARERPELFGRRFYQRLLEGTLVTGADYVQALRARSAVACHVADAMVNVDAIAIPTTVAPASTFENDDDRIPQKVRTFFTSLFNLTGQPAITVPCGFSGDLPIGLQIAARPMDDHIALALAHAFEATVPKRWPPLDRQIHPDPMPQAIKS